MHLEMLRSKLHNATVTEARKDYQGSLSIDSDLMERVRMYPFEKILVANLSNGNRFETYAIAAPPGSGTICLNGPAALLGSAGDRIVILSFASITEEELPRHKPFILVLGKDNKPVGGLADV